MSEVAVQYAVYINLDERDDRRTHMESMLSEAGWQFDRLSATRLDQSPESAGLKMIPRLEGHKGVASIWLSHERALNRFLAVAEDSEEAGSYLLLEDDVKVLSPTYLQNPLPLPDGLSNDWEIILLSPRFRWKNKANIPPEDEGKYFTTPYEKGVWVNLNEARENFIITGAHYVIFRSQSVVLKVLDRMKERSLYDVDNFYVSDFETYGVGLSKVTAGGFGSDHNYE